jgi:FlgN protein
VVELENVSRILWRERGLLELLQFKLEEEQLLLAAGRTKWLAHAANEVEAVIDQLRQLEVLRAAEVDMAAAAVGLPPGSSLASLADASGEPWTSILHSHRQAFLTLTGELTAVAAANRDLLTTGERATREALMSWTDNVRTYTAKGAASDLSETISSAGARVVDRAV